MSYTKDMRRDRIKKTITYLSLLFLLCLLVACGQQEKTTDDGVTYFHHSIADRNTQETQENSTETEKSEEFLLTAVDQIQESLQLYRYADGMEYRYYYGTGTRFYDKYGNRTPVTSFEPGLLVTIGDVDSEGILTEARISDQAWVYDNITRFSVNPDLDMLKIGDGKYRYTDDTIVFSGDKRIQMTDLSDGDTLSVVGRDKNILAVRVTTAQGTLALSNTKLFEESFLQLGTKIFAEITPDMEIQVPEGTYELRVANNGWGGSTEVTITRGETTNVDLDTLKGEGPSYGKVQFVIDAKDAVLSIDGKETDYEKPVKLTYGSHTITVYSSDYDTWKRNLYVNSEKSTIVINLADEDSSETGNSQSSSESSSQSSSQGSSQSSSESSSQSSSQESSGSQSEYKNRQEELDTLKDLISSMTSSSSLVSK